MVQARALIGPTLLALAVLAASASRATEVAAVVAHPPVDAFFACTEHGAGILTELGDNLGQDCVVQRLITENGRTWLRPYAKDGSRNEDWYGFGMDLMSPCDCKVVAVEQNAIDNKPGIMGNSRAAGIELENSDGVHFALGHIQEPKVRVGDTVKAGDIIARIGNNGYSRLPHLHIGAWKDRTPLQIRWDLNKMPLPTEYRRGSN